ncbi:hypothetical protein GE061_002822 [Apolygus lucorum]|uniref:Uncharacterized protein n=1 Tax=Apolygus lucorum TaxID=248454 RepID=A0A6A4J732_APOLU|nr:hypothetical protein GE061_002822 [Apolygus lucorum]
MRCCSVMGCEYSVLGKKKTSDVSFHKVPDKYKRPHDYLEWKRALQIKKLPMTTWVCSLHFDDADYHHRVLPSICKFLSYKPRRTLRLDAVPHLNLKPQERDTSSELLLPTVIQGVDVQHEGEKHPYFPQETVYLPSSSTELYEENSEGEQSNASSEDQAILFDEDSPFPKVTHLSQVQCESGTERCRASSDDPDLVDTARRSTGNADDAASEDLDGIATISADQGTQGYSRKDEYRLERRVESNQLPEEFNVGRYECIADGECPCGLPKANHQPNFDSIANEKSNNEEDNNETNKDECSDDANYGCSVCENNDNKTLVVRWGLRQQAKETSYSRSMKFPHRVGNHQSTLELSTSKLMLSRQRQLLLLRQTMSSIVHKRSTPNILRKRHR